MGGRTTRSKISNLKPTSREDHKAQEPVQVNINKAAGVQSRSRRADRFSYLFVLGHSPWADVCDPFDYLDEQAHFCECPACQNLSYLLSPGSIETFLQRQLSRTESLIQDPSTRPGPDDGCFRLWLEWRHSALCYKGHLVGIGSIQIHQREGNVGNSLVRSLHEIHPGWQACGNPHRQRGCLLLFKENGFAALTSDDGPCQAVSIFVHKTLHYVRGPSYSRNSKCPCGCWVEGQTQCHRQLPGPRNFVILFQSGRLRFNDSGSLMCYQGKYQVQPMCLSLHRLSPKLCGLGCQGGGLVA